MADKDDLPEGRWVTLSDAAAYFKTSERTLRRRLKTGELRARKESGRVFVLVYGQMDTEADKSERAAGMAESSDSAPAELARLRAEVEKLEALLVRADEERDYLRQALAAALSKLPQIEARASEVATGSQAAADPERAGPLERLRRWWKG